MAFLDRIFFVNLVLLVDGIIFAEMKSHELLTYGFS